MTKITIQATVKADKQKVWDYYTNPGHIVNWNFASEDWHCPSATNDLQAGGKYQARMEARDGSWGFDFEAVYTAVTAGQSYTYVMPDGRVVDVQLSAAGDGTEVTITFDAEDQNPIQMQRDGWQSILNNFKKYAELQ
ncbi:MAG: SRPBCC family protein [Phaeodactylibacter sp.]|nr:SRPBCC family protein [Phaeodactylibacter sp.]